MRGKLVFVLPILLSGCASGEMMSPGIIYTSESGAVGTAAQGAYAPFPHDTPDVVGIFGLFAWGDASIARAREIDPRQGLVAHIDYHKESVLGITHYHTSTYGTSP